ncbi:MAG: MFS transporter [Acidobacteria bacterium]|nr:MFS transporter [Acidobacteriota bacterium]
MRSKSRYAWMVVLCLWFVWLLNYLDRQAFYSVFPLLQSNLRLSNFQLGLLSTSFLWVYAIASPLAGYLADRFGRKNIIVMSLLVWSLMTWATGKARNFQELLWVRGLMGVSEAAYLPAGLAMIADYHRGKTRSLATGLHFSGGYLGIVLGGVIGGWIGEHYGWRSAFVVLGVIGILYALFVAGILHEDSTAVGQEAHHTKVEKSGVIASLRELCSTRAFSILAVVFGITSLANWLVYTWMPIYLYERFHMSLLSAGFSATFYIQAGSMGGIALGGIFADRWGSRWARGRLLTQAAGLALVGPFLCIVGITSSPRILLVALVVFGIGRGAYDANCMPVLCQIVRPGLRATGYGFFNFVGTVAGGAIAAAAGAMKSSLGLGGIMEVVGVLLLVGAFLLFCLPVSDAGNTSSVPAFEAQ